MIFAGSTGNLKKVNQQVFTRPISPLYRKQASSSSQKNIMIQQNNQQARDFIFKSIKRSPKSKFSATSIINRETLNIRSEKLIQIPNSSTASQKIISSQQVIQNQNNNNKKSVHRLELRKDNSSTSIKFASKISLAPISNFPKTPNQASQNQNTQNMKKGEISFAISEEASPSIDRSQFSVWDDGDQVKSSMEQYDSVSNPVEQWASLFKYRYENFPSKQEPLTQERLEKFFSVYGGQSKNKWRKLLNRYPIDHDRIENFEEKKIEQPRDAHTKFFGRQFIIRKQ